MAAVLVLGPLQRLHTEWLRAAISVRIDRDDAPLTRFLSAGFVLSPSAAAYRTTSGMVMPKAALAAQKDHC